MKSFLLIASLSLVIAFTGNVIADPGHDNAPPARVLKVALNLDDDQLTALRELIETRSGEVKAINEEIHELESQLKALLESDAPDQTEVGGLVLDIRTLKQEIAQGHEAYQQSFRAILTPDQVERLGHINRIAIAARAADVLHKLKLH